MIVETAKCLMRGWEYSDLDDLVVNANNQKIAVNMRDIFPYPYTHGDGEKWIDFVQNQEPTTDFAVVFEGVAVGGIGLNIGQDIERLSAELGYWIGEKHWGMGLASEAVKGIVKYGFKDLELERIFAKPFEQNTASRRVLERNGFILEGVLQSSVIKFDKIFNQTLYAITK